MASTTQHTSLTVDELERLVQRVEPAALLVPPRLLRRVIKQHRHIGGIGLRVPHRKGYVINRAALLDCVAPAELGLAPNAELPAHVFLLVRPDPARLARYAVAEALKKHWRILFHLHIDLAMQQKLADGSLTPALVRQRIRRLGLTEFAEITAVLRQEDYLLPPESPEAVYAEFVAVYLTMRRFDPARMPHFFPALRDRAAVEAVVAEDIDAEALFGATRLCSEADKEPGRQADKEPGPNAPSVSLSPYPPVSLPSSPLNDRLQRALELSDADADRWRAALLPIAAQSVQGSWNQEARLLSDLQSVCDDSEHGINTVDLVEWMMSLGELPVKRQLPGHQEVVIVRHLRRALGRMRFVQVTDGDRQRLIELLTHALEQRERLMRARFRPLIAGAMDEVGLKPNNVAEAIGRAKLIEELLDRVVEFGHLNLGNLRDALSRNQLKLPDLKGPAEFFRGDPLIRLNRKLAVALDGVYRRGEFYMRLLHRLSSLGFGTGFGRLFVLFLIVPFGLAYFVMITPGIALEEGEKLTHFVRERVGLKERSIEAPRPAFVELMEEDWDKYDFDAYEMQPPAPPPVHRTTHEFPMPNLWGVAGLGAFFVILFNVSSFRHRFFAGLGKLGHEAHRGVAWLFNLPALQTILHNRFWTPFRRCVFWPVLAAALSGSLVWWYDLGTPSALSVAAGFLTLVLVLLNTRLGRDLEETGTDWLMRYWVWFSADFLPGLLRLIMDLSRRCMEGIEQVLYAVNEWLRFRSGANQFAIVVKAVLGLLWFGVTYVVRFAVNLLIEPQVNPIKHFPVVTVSHKVCLPMIPTLAEIFRNMAVRRPTATATGIIFGIPGIFGFMVWELKENWRLYRSNRAANLQPVLIGSHGETMLRLLRPGFHSGTIPKLFNRLRRAERHEPTGTMGGRSVRKALAALHHVAESIAHFVERELLALLRQSQGWGGLSIELAHVRLATNRVSIELHCPTLDEPPLVIAFDQQSGWLLAGVLEAGWLPRLNADQARTLTAALAGLYRLAGVDLTREQINESFREIFAFEIIDDGLLVWTGADADHDAIYDLSAGPEVLPKPRRGILPVGLPVLDAARLLLSDAPLAWTDWVQTWEDDRASMHADTSG